MRRILYLAMLLEQVKQKKNLPEVQQVRWKTYHEGQAAHIMHVGPFSQEGPTVEKVHSFIKDKGLLPIGKHHEIYLNDMRRTAPERLKTIIRQPVKKK